MREITDEDIDKIGDLVGMAPGGWDSSNVNPKELIEAVLEVMAEERIRTLKTIIIAFMQYLDSRWFLTGIRKTRNGEVVQRIRQMLKDAGETMDVTP